MATMVAPSRPVALERAAELVRECYGFTPHAMTRLTGERDENFRLAGDDGAEYVLKIANPAENPAETDFQTAALLHLANTDPGLPSPRVVRERRGGMYVRFADQGVERTARMLTYLPGKLLGASVRSPRQRTACGRIGARLTLALRGFAHPAERRTILWDVRHTGHMQHLLTEMPRLHRVGAIRRNQLGGSDRNVRDHRRVRHVAEIDDSGHAVLVGGVDQDIEGV